MFDNGVSTGTSGWDFFVYSISGGLMVSYQDYPYCPQLINSLYLKMRMFL